MQTPDYKKFYVFAGPGNNGKTVYTRVIEKMLNRDNCSHISMQDLSKSRFAPAELFGKLCNIHADIPRHVVEYASVLKSLTGGDTTRGERKFGHGFSFMNRAVLVFASNELPQVDDNTEAFWNRIEIINLPNRFEKNPGFIEMITNDKNISGLFNLVLDEMDAIEKDGKILEIMGWYDTMLAWNYSSNNVYAFFVDCIRRGTPNDHITADMLYTLYIRYCNETNASYIVNDKAFSLEMGKLNIVRGRKKIDRRVCLVYFGVKYDEGVEDEKSATRQDMIIKGGDNVEE
jgi:putative DNA primase/helicase